MEQDTLQFVKQLLAKEYEKVQGRCHDCGKVVLYDIGLDDEGKVGASGPIWHFSYIAQGMFMKCLPCYEKDPILRNFRPTEVHNRVSICGKR